MQDSNDDIVVIVCVLLLLWYLHSNGYLSLTFESCSDNKEHYSPVGNAPPMDPRYFTQEQYWLYYLYSLLTMQGTDSGNPVLMTNREDTAAANSNYRALQVLPVGLSNGGKAWGPFSPYNSSAFVPNAIQNNAVRCGN